MISSIFKFKLCDGVSEEFLQRLELMNDRVKTVDGFLGEEACRSLFDEEMFVSISYWRDYDALLTWRNDPEHKETQQLGKDKFFTWYEIQILESQREYSWQKP